LFKIVHSKILFTFSSASFAGLNRIFISGLEINNVGTAFRFYGKKNVKTHNIFIKDIVAGNIIGSFLYFRMINVKRSFLALSGVHIKNSKVENCGRAFVLLGDASNPVQGIKISDSGFKVSKSSFLKYAKQFELNNVRINDSLITIITDVGKNEFPEIYLKSSEDEVLNKDDIQYNLLPSVIKEVLNQDYAYVPINDIDRIETSSKVIYQISLEIEAYKEVEIVVEENGELLSSKSGIDYHDLPENVFVAIKNYLGVEPDIFIFNEINQIDYKDFTYYEIIGEYNQKLFALSVAENGKIIEKKQQTIASCFLQH
jgi:hypothetical protein